MNRRDLFISTAGLMMFANGPSHSSEQEAPAGSEKIETVFFDLGDTLVTDKKWLPGAKDCLGTLSLFGLRVGIISNTGAMSREELAEKYLPQDFDFSAFEDPLVILSSEVGVRKPKPEIWRLAAEKARGDVKRCLFVGEDLRETWVAQEVGMRSIRVCSFPSDMESLAKLVGCTPDDRQSR